VRCAGAAAQRSLASTGCRLFDHPIGLIYLRSETVWLA
jgi:hypothetical protein